MEKVHVQIIAFDKNSNENTGRSIVADSKESFNEQVEEFENEVPYTKFYVEMIADEVLSDEQLEIVADHDVN
jgi:hypothetical protein